MSFIRENPLYKNINGIKPQATLLSIYWGQNAEWYKGSMKHGFEMLLGVTLRHCSEPVPFSFLSSFLNGSVSCWMTWRIPVTFISMCFAFLQEMEQSMNMLNSNHELPDVSEFMTRLFSSKSSGKSSSGSSKTGKSGAGKRR